MRVCILDYGSGNVQSVYNMLSTIESNVVISNNPDDIVSATHIILPGVGAFRAAMKKIKNTIPMGVLKKEVFEKKKPFLGICVGLQVLADKGYEFGEYNGLGWIEGTVEKLEVGSLPLPHIGWNSIRIVNPSPLLDHFDNNQDFYFVHSFAFKEKHAAHIVATTEYEQEFNSIISKGNIYGVQFHPEKSQKAGKVLLENFLKIS